MKQSVKIVEINAMRLEHILCKSYPWGDTDCGRTDYLRCSTCEDNDKGRCRTTNILIQTNLLNLQGKKMDYWGQSSRSGYTRGEPPMILRN